MNKWQHLFADKQVCLESLLLCLYYLAEPEQFTLYKGVWQWLYGVEVDQWKVWLSKPVKTGFVRFLHGFQVGILFVWRYFGDSVVINVSLYRNDELHVIWHLWQEITSSSFMRNVFYRCFKIVPCYHSD